MDLVLLSLVIGAYFVAMLGVGVYFSRRQTSTQAYFLAEQSIPGWAVGLSLFATLVSSVSFLAYPAAGYEGKWWASFVPVVTAPLQAVVIVCVLIPMYRHLIAISVYEYIERRFDRITRIYSAIAFFLLNLGKMALVFYLVGLTLNAVTGWSIEATIVCVGLITVTYTFLGGVEAVIWTDALQAVILWIGALVALAWAVLAPEGGPTHSLAVVWDNRRFDFGEMSLAVDHPTFLILMLVGFIEGLQKAASDQSIVQRFLVARTQGHASRGVLLSAVLTLLAAGLFTLIGSCLWSFYKLTGTSLPEHLERTEEIFPHFLATVMPGPFAAIVIAALLAAAMSTVSSALNGFASVAVADYYALARPLASDRRRLSVGRSVVIATGALCVGLALLLVQTRGTAIQLWYLFASVVSAGVLGLFFVAIFSRRTSCAGAYGGIAVAIGFTGWAVMTTDWDSTSPSYQTFDLGMMNAPVHSYLIGVGSTVLFVFAALAVSLVWPENDEDRRSLTIWGQLKRQSSAAALGHANPRASWRE